MAVTAGRLDAASGAKDDLLNPQAEEPLGVVKAPDPASVGQGHEALRRHILHELEVGPLIHRGRVDVEQGEFVDLLLVEDPDGVDGIADVGRLIESPGLDQPVDR